MLLVSDAVIPSSNTDQDNRSFLSLFTVPTQRPHLPKNENDSRFWAEINQQGGYYESKKIFGWPMKHFRVILISNDASSSSDLTLYWCLSLSSHLNWIIQLKNEIIFFLPLTQYEDSVLDWLKRLFICTFCMFTLYSVRTEIQISLHPPSPLPPKNLFQIK